MRIKSVKNKIRRLCGVTAAAAVIALTGWGCVESTDPDGNDGNLILPKGEAWVYTYEPYSIPQNINTGSPARTVEQNRAFIFKANGDVDMLTRRGTLWVAEPFQVSWSTRGNKLTLHEIGGDESEDITFTFSLTGEDSLQILTLQLSDSYYVSVEGYERKAITIRTPPTVTTFKDSRDGTEYKKVTIGKQTWMAENLNYDASGSVCYANSADSCSKYGRLYDWETAMSGASGSSEVPSGVRGVCPAGWHLPSDAEWDTLIMFVGSSMAGTILKSTMGWYYNDYGADNYGFAALPGGLGYGNGGFSGVVQYGYWWSTTEYDANHAWFRNMRDYDESVGRTYYGNRDKADLFSVRCVQN